MLPMLNPDNLPTLSAIQHARLTDKIASALFAILEEARTDHAAAHLAHVLASEHDAEAALEIQVASSGAVDVAIHALMRYIAWGTYYADQGREPQIESLHERCRLARNAIDQKISTIFDGVSHANHT